MTYKTAFATPALVAVSLLAAVQPAVSAPPDGAVLFRQRCQTCHSATPDKTTPLGPNLAGVVGRKSASTTFNYTPALRKANVVWNRANLDRFLTAPTRMVPGTRMVMPVSDPQQRAAILDFLARSGK